MPRTSTSSRLHNGADMLPGDVPKEPLEVATQVAMGKASGPGGKLVRDLRNEANFQPQSADNKPPVAAHLPSSDLHKTT